MNTNQDITTTTAPTKRKYVRKNKLVIVEELESDNESVDDDDESTISSIVESSVSDEKVEEPLPELESDPIVLRTLVADLQAEVIRLTKFNQELQRRLEGERRQPKKKTEKTEKKEGKRKITRDKRPEDYAQQYMKTGQVLKWKHIKRDCWAEATYIGAGKFSAKYSFTEDEDEGISLHSVGAKMSRHLTIHGVNAWTSFKNTDGTSVANLDLQKA